MVKYFIVGYLILLLLEVVWILWKYSKAYDDIEEEEDDYY